MVLVWKDMSWWCSGSTESLHTGSLRCSGKGWHPGSLGPHCCKWWWIKVFLDALRVREFCSSKMQTYRSDVALWSLHLVSQQLHFFPALWVRQPSSDSPPLELRVILARLLAGNTYSFLHVACSSTSACSCSLDLQLSSEALSPAQPGLTFDVFLLS